MYQIDYDQKKKDAKTWTSMTCPVSLLSAAIPTSLATPRPSKRAITWLPSHFADIAVIGRAVVGRDRHHERRPEVCGRDVCVAWVAGREGSSEVERLIIMDVSNQLL